jgi:hypothetical protein
MRTTRTYREETQEKCYKLLRNDAKHTIDFKHLIIYVNKRILIPCL